MVLRRRQPLSRAAQGEPGRRAVPGEGHPFADPGPGDAAGVPSAQAGNGGGFRAWAIADQGRIPAASGPGANASDLRETPRPNQCRVADSNAHAWGWRAHAGGRATGRERPRVRGRRGRVPVEAPRGALLGGRHSIHRPAPCARRQRDRQGAGEAVGDQRRDLDPGRIPDSHPVRVAAPRVPAPRQSPASGVGEGQGGAGRDQARDPRGQPRRHPHHPRCRPRRWRHRSDRGQRVGEHLRLRRHGARATRARARDEGDGVGHRPGPRARGRGRRSRRVAADARPAPARRPAVRSRRARRRGAPALDPGELAAGPPQATEGRPRAGRLRVDSRRLAPPGGSWAHGLRSRAGFAAQARVGAALALRLPGGQHDAAPALSGELLLAIRGALEPARGSDREVRDAVRHPGAPVRAGALVGPARRLPLGARGAQVLARADSGADRDLQPQQRTGPGAAGLAEGFAR